MTASDRVRLWSDEPSAIDLLAFDAVAETAVEAVLDDVLDPLAIGVSGPWGSGKSTVLQLIERQLKERSETDEKILVVSTDPWRYDPAVGAKATLISEVLSELENELKNAVGDTAVAADNLLKKLAKRVNWVKALKMAAKTSITLQLPNIDELSSLINEDPEADDGGESKTLDDFRNDFEELLSDPALKHVKRVVVLVDDLDRCLPPTVVETLETMRLFLAVPKMSFVIAADEDRVADALRDRYPAPSADRQDEQEELARLYLHKIVQTTLQLPALSRYDTEAYLLLLLLQLRSDDDVSAEAFESILASSTGLRTTAGSLDELEVPSGLDVTSERQFAARLTPMLYEKLRGSPRRIKRFLNDLNVRASVARRRGIELDLPVVAKLMILELLLPDEFEEVLKWLARGELRERLGELERRAGKTVGDEVAATATPVTEPEDDSELAKKTARKSTKRKPDDDESKDKAEDFSENFVRWAKLPPSLAEIDLSPYLHLAASFASTPLIDTGLPERLRDIAANLLSSSRAEQKAVTDDDLRGLGAADAATLVDHLGRIARDRPNEMRRGVDAILRITASVPAAFPAAERALKGLPVTDIRPPVILLFSPQQAPLFASVLDEWSDRSKNPAVKSAIATVVGQRPS